MPDRENLVSIGEMAKLFDLSVETLRYYEKIGLVLPEYVSEKSGYRYYGARQFEQLNSIRYLRKLNMPLEQISDFIHHREIETIEQQLHQQKQIVENQIEELEKIRSKIDNRLNSIERTRQKPKEVIWIEEMKERKILEMNVSLYPKHWEEMEQPIQDMIRDQSQGLVFLGKIGLSMKEQKLKSGNFDGYDSLFLLLENEDHFTGTPTAVPAGTFACLQFHGSHQDAAPYYRILTEWIRSRNMAMAGPSREITLIDYGLTSDPGRFVTEIQIPVTADFQSENSDFTWLNL